MQPGTSGLAFLKQQVFFTMVLPLASNKGLDRVQSPGLRSVLRPMSTYTLVAACMVTTASTPCDKAVHESRGIE